MLQIANTIRGSWTEIINATDCKAVADKNIKKETRELLAFLLFEIWKKRCNRTFRDKNRPQHILTSTVIEAFKQYKANTRLI
jgi:hypothetical protein